MIAAKKKHQGAGVIVPPIISVSDESAVTKATETLMSGKVIAVPTDTIYGIASLAQNNNGIRCLYEIKMRDKHKPIAICVGDVNQISLYGDTSHLSLDLLNSLLPGPVTIVLKRKSLLNPLLNPEAELVGIRIPQMSFIQKVVKACKAPLALTSANISSEPSSLEISEFSHLWPCLGGVFDGGVLTGSRAGSTVVDLSEPGYFSIIRPGSALESTLVTLKKFGLLQQQLGDKSFLVNQNEHKFANN